MGFVLAFLVVALSTPPIRRYALKRKLGDKPNGRKIHTSMIPHLGGIGMVIGVWASLTLLAVLTYLERGVIPDTAFRVFVPVGMIVVLGLVDDTKSLRARQKLAVQILASVIIAVAGVRLFVGIPGLDEYLLFSGALTAFYLVGMSSSVNLIDGLDGLAAGVSLVSALAFGVAAALLGAPSVVFVALSLAGACLGFLLYNFPPGKIFMGDTGSLFLGTMLGILACAVTMAEPAVTTFFGVGFILAVPMLDTWLAIARRIVLRRPVFEADHQHIHHVLISLGLSTKETLAVLYSMQAVMAVLGILAIKGFFLPVVGGAALLVAVFSTFYRMMVSAKEQAAEPATDFVRGVPSLEK